MINVVNRARATALLLSSGALCAPSLASADATQIIVRCAIPQACASTKNTVNTGLQGITAGTSGTSAGVRGLDTSTNAGYNDGVLGTVINGGYGVEGDSGDNALGGVRGVGTTGLGVYGTSTGSYGIYGTSSSSAGVVGISNSSSGLYASSISGKGVEGHSSSADAGYFGSTSGTAVEANSSTGYGLVARTGGSVGAYVTNSNGNATDVTGSYIGLLGRSNTYPITLTDAAAAILFYVDGSGNVWSHGTYHTFAATRSGQPTTAYSTQTTMPTVEDVGSAELLNGAASVKFDPAFAASIDSQRAYQVFLTPGGDTRGLFVASKTANGFTVRETQGGRGRLSFDYRIVARPVGQTRERMAFANPASSGQPKADLIMYRAQPPSKLPALQRTHRREAL